MSEPALEQTLERLVEGLGYELVEFERAGSARRPILRLRIDRPDTRPGQGITIEECATVSRALSAHLDADPALPATHVLEVSSPGVERPIPKPRDWKRFAGEPVAVLGKAPLAGRARRLEGTLIGPVGEESAPRLGLRLPGGEEVEIRPEEITRAHLLFQPPGSKKARGKDAGPRRP